MDPQSEALTAVDWRRIVVAGAATLFVELALIRYIPGQVRVLGYFTNFVLLAAFLGFGVGMLATRRWPGARWIGAAAPVALLVVVGLVEVGTTLQVLPSPEQFLFIEYQTVGTRIPLYPFLALSFVLLATGFVPLGYCVGETLRGDRPLLRYGLNIFGSLLGIIAFVVMSAVVAPPWLWMLIAAGFALAVQTEIRVSWRAGGVVAGLLVAGLSWHATRGATWSPYQKLSTGPVHIQPGEGVVQEWRLPLLPPEKRAAVVQLTAAEGFTVRVNDDSYQTPLDLSDAGVKRHPEFEGLRRQYDLPFMLSQHVGEVLVLGAGTGNDVAAALRGGATRVDAVEIDPEILRHGSQHPEQPYSDSRVTTHVEDARTFLSTTSNTYDMIVFGLVDSHVLLSSRSTVRLDSFVFTSEAFSLARARLKEKGVMFVSHAVGAAWFSERMRATLTESFGRPPQVVSDKVYHPLGVIYASGSSVKSGAPTPPGVEPLMDDWPFLYLKSHSIPDDYLVAMLLMALASLLGVRLVSGRRFADMDLHFFALGAGFLLLETRGLGVLALLLGSTWSVTSAVFAGTLVMALLATLVAARLGGIDARLRGGVYFALAVCIAVNFFVPVATLSAMPLWLRVVAGAGLVSLPIFASGIIFGLSLGRSGNAERAIASNLVGAMLGGLIEYASMVTGFRYLLLLAGAFYMLALLAEVREGGPSPAPSPTV